jgi:hypothetical protein
MSRGYGDDRREIYQDPMMMGMGSTYSPPLALPSERADLLDKIKPTMIVFDVMHRLLGETVGTDGVWRADPRLKEKSLSFTGAWDLATLMLSASSQNVSLSKLKDHEIRLRALSIARTAQIMCLRNWKEYNIRGVDQLRFVHEVIFSNTFITLKQPQDEGIRRMLMNTMSAEVMPMQDQQMMMPQGKGGWLSGLFRK